MNGKRATTKEVKKKLKGFIHSIQWSNPYTSPPSGAPRILAEVFTLGRMAPPEFNLVQYSRGGGYVKTIAYVEEVEIKELSRESLANVRKKRLARRVNSKVPMFAEFFIEQEVAKKPDYYDGITDDQITKNREEALEYHARRIAFFRTRIGMVIVHGQEPQECKEVAQRLQDDLSGCRSGVGESDGIIITH